MSLRFSIIIVLISNVLHAQKPHVVNLEKHQLENITIGCHVEKVIDVRENKSNIGFALTGMLNQPVPVYLAHSPEEEFQSLFIRSFSAHHTTPLIIRINHLDVYEFSAMKEVAYAVLNLTFIIKDSINYIEQFESAVVIENKGADVTRSHSKNIVNALQQSFSDYQQRLLAGSLRNDTITEEELFINPLKQNHYNILSVKKIPKAIFHSFYDFRDYNPDTSHNFEIFQDEYSWDARQKMIKWQGANSKIKDAWGFSDGKNVHIKLDKYYYPLTREGDEFTLYTDRISTGSSGNSQGAFAAGFFGGLIGGLIYASVKQNEPGVVKCKVNFANGNLAPIIETKNGPMSENVNRPMGEVYIYFSSYSQEGIMEVFINGEKKCSMNRDTYFLYTNNSGTPQLSLCVKVNSQEYCKQIEADIFSTNVYLCKIKKYLPQLETLSADLESSLLNEIRTGKYLQSCE